MKRSGIADFFSSLVSTSVLSVPYTSKRPIIIDAPYPPLRAVSVSRPGGLLLRTGTTHIEKHLHHRDPGS